MKSNLDETIKSVVGLAPAKRGTGTTAGPSVDTQGFDELLWQLNLGVLITGGTVTVKAQESGDNSTWADISAGTFGAKNSADVNSIHVMRINLRKRKRYQRLFATVAGTTNTLNSAVGALGGLNILPVSQVNTVVSINTQSP